MCLTLVKGEIDALIQASTPAASQLANDLRPPLEPEDKP
jgi:hypothetical protein